FISPMGEPFRARTAADDTLRMWFQGADRNGDGALSATEMQADAERFFASLDSDHNGEIDPVELDHYELEIAPEIQVTARTMPAPGAARPKQGRTLGFDVLMGTGGALQGGARYALLNIPEPVAAADTDYNRGVSLAEFRLAAGRRFQLRDTARAGQVSLAQLESVRQASIGRKAKPGQDVPDERVGNGLPAGN
ncbi:MAG: hypothetical protein ACJ8E3_08320, partial [Sphingomicrobium sp.]